MSVLPVLHFARGMYTARAQCTDECTDSVHYTCCVLNAHPGCKCTSGSLLVHVQYTVQQTFAPTMHFHVQKLHQPRHFRHRTGILVQNISCVAHCCAEKPRIAELFRHCNVTNQPLSARIETPDETDGDRCGCFSYRTSGACAEFCITFSFST